MVKEAVTARSSNDLYGGSVGGYSGAGPAYAGVSGFGGCGNGSSWSGVGGAGGGSAYVGGFAASAHGGELASGGYAAGGPDLGSPVLDGAAAAAMGFGGAGGGEGAACGTGSGRTESLYKVQVGESFCPEKNEGRGRQLTAVHAAVACARL